MKELLSKLNNLHLDNKKLIFSGLVVLIIIYLDITLVLKPQIKSIANTSAKIVKLKKDLLTLDKDLVAMRQSQALQVKVAKPKKLISEGEVNLVLEKIYNLANKHNIKIIQIKPYKDLATKEVFAGGKVIPLTLTMDLACTYHSLGGFINDLENATQFMAVENLKIIRSSQDYLRQDVNLVVKTYVKK